jgi:hypothetical protein
MQLLIVPKRMLTDAILEQVWPCETAVERSTDVIWFFHASSTEPAMLRRTTQEEVICHVERSLYSDHDRICGGLYIDRNCAAAIKLLFRLQCTCLVLVRRREYPLALRYHPSRKTASICQHPLAGMGSLEQ